MVTRRRHRPITSKKVSPLRDFLRAEATGGAAVVVAGVAALVWANSPWSGSYADLWTTDVSLSVGTWRFGLDLHQWINDGLMTLFFLVVGLEIKREMTDGHLATGRAALAPAIAAVGGMVVPALLYLAIAGRVAPRGWAVPMATDIALAVGILSLVSQRVVGSVRSFLLGLAIVDDIGAILVIALVYSSQLSAGWLTVATAAFAGAVVLREVGVQTIWAYVVVGAVLWYALHEGGIHPTIAGVALGLLAPSVPRVPPELVDVEELADVSTLDAARDTVIQAKGSVSVVEWLQHVLHPWTSLLIVPLFALANAGIPITTASLTSALHSPISWGIFVGLVLGKPLGITLARRSLVALGATDDPEGATQRQLTGTSVVAGVGFTVAIFVTDLAFTDPEIRSIATLAVLAASVVAGMTGVGILVVGRPRRTP